MMRRITCISLLLLPLTVFGTLGKTDKKERKENLSPIIGGPGSDKLGKKAVIVFENGLKIEELKAGKGNNKAQDGSRVTVHYTGRFTNGKKFDSSRDRDLPFEFPLGAGQVIKGWEIGLRGMKPGGKRRITIPASLAYGKRGAPPLIGPNETLVFDIEMISVE